MGGKDGEGKEGRKQNESRRSFPERKKATHIHCAEARFV